MTDPSLPDAGASTPGRRAARPVDDGTATRRIVVGDDSRVREVGGTRDARHGAADRRATDGGDEAFDQGDTVERPALRLDDDADAPVTTRHADHDPDLDPDLDADLHADDGREPADDDEAPAQKPVGEALGGFFAGMAYVLVLPVLWWVLSDPDTPADLFTADLVFFLPAILVPVALAIVPRTRRFGRYMLLGVGLSAVVVVGVAALVLAFLIVTGR